MGSLLPYMFWSAHLDLDDVFAFFSQSLLHFGDFGNELDFVAQNRRVFLAPLAGHLLDVDGDSLLWSHSPSMSVFESRS